MASRALCLAAALALAGCNASALDGSGLDRLVAAFDTAAAAELRAANAACARWPAAHAAFVAIAATGRLRAADIATEARVAAALRTACAGAPFATLGAQAAGALGAWTSFVAAARAGGVDAEQ